jgi:hypothetical protein
VLPVTEEPDSRPANTPELPLEADQSLTLTPALVETPIPLEEPTLGCETHQADLQLVPSSAALHVGQTLTLTATLTSSGCAMLGLPKYSLSMEPGAGSSPLLPVAPEPVLHSIGLRDGEQDAAQFSMQAVVSGEVFLQASVSFEVHLGYPGPAYWASATSSQVLVQVSE